MPSKKDTCTLVAADLSQARTFVQQAQQHGFGVPPPDQSIRQAMGLLIRSMRKLERAYPSAIYPSQGSVSESVKE